MKKIIHPKSKIKIGLVTSPGGHLTKTLMLKNWWSRYDRFWVTGSPVKSLNLLKDDKVYFGHFPENRHLLNFLKNLLLAWRVLTKEKPNLLSEYKPRSQSAPPPVRE